MGGAAEQEQVILLRDSAGDNKVQILLLMTRPRIELMNGLPRDRRIFAFFDDPEFQLLRNSVREFMFSVFTTCSFIHQQRDRDKDSQAKDRY